MNFGLSTCYPSFPRKRESRGQECERVPWTPAFAGVTIIISLSPGRENGEHTREVDMPRRGVAVAVIVIVAAFIVLGLASGFLVDWAWFSAVGYLDVFWTILGGQAVLFFAVFAGSAILLWVNGTLALRFARRRGHVLPVDFGRESEGVQTLPELLELMGQSLPWRLLIAGVAGVLAILLAFGEVSNWDVFLRF